MTDGTTDGVSIDAGVEEDINLGTRADPPGMTDAETGCGCHSQHQNRSLGLLLSLIFVLPMALRRKNAWRSILNENTTHQTLPMGAFFFVRFCL